jgi:BMFP domain-containing protein YqiC
MREIEGLQAEALKCLNAGAFSGLMDLVQKQESLQSRIAQARQELAPLLKKFEELSASEKENLRNQGVGEVLQQIEITAASIQGRHQGAFPETTALSRSQDSQDGAPASSNNDDDLQNRISRFRSG